MNPQKAEFRNVGKAGQLRFLCDRNFAEDAE